MNVRPTNLEASEVFLVARVSCICLFYSGVLFFFFHSFSGDNMGMLAGCSVTFLLLHENYGNFFFLLMQYFFLCLYYIVRCNVVCFLHNSDFI